MTRNRFSRREFIGLGAAAAGASLGLKTILLDPDPLWALPQTVAPSDRVRFGMIGIGMQGSGLLANSIELPGVQCVAACDLYDGRHTLAKEIVGPNLPTTRRYHELLENKEIDCIVAAVPDHWHKQVVVDAVSAGKDIYIEKPMSHTGAEGVEMVAAAQKNGRIVQVGSQRVSSVICAKAKELVAQGVLGDLMLVEGSLGRNDPTGAWEYPPPTDLSPQTLDWDTWQGTVPKRDFDPLIFARWRCWKEYGTGVAGDLMVHLISGMLFTLGLNEAPRRVTALGGIRRFNDGRNMPDVHMSLYEYKNMPVYIRLNLGSASPEVLRFYGSQGILELSENGLSFGSQPGVDLGPSYYAGSFPENLRGAYEKSWHAEHDPKPGEEPLYDGVNYVGDSYDDTRPHLWKYFQAVKSRQPVVQDVVFGHHAAIACHMANESYFRGRAVVFDPATDTLKTE
ncbi:MAG TPA: Gfo/Idh/MocA family oxidoreductase [Tepidisphaeraceae bacterium]|nr:Gfo/Idh/MocA family oxidoreductase [Tepidisphaeraceae bacterium]